jgi:hypothetical protein
MFKGCSRPIFVAKPLSQAKFDLLELGEDSGEMRFLRFQKRLEQVRAFAKPIQTLYFG